MFIPVKTYKDQPVQLIQEKADGMCIHVEKTADRQIIVSTRTPGTTLDLPAHLFRHAPPMTKFLAELHMPGLPATSVVTKRIEDPDSLTITPFAVLQFGGEEMAHVTYGNEVIDEWKLVETRIKSMGFFPPATETLSEPIPLTVSAFQDRARARGIEGYVVKQSHLYGWYKIKPVRSVDCVVMSVKRSTSVTFYGGLKAIVVGVYCNGELKRIASVGGGFDAEFRMDCDPDSLVDRVAEVSYDSLAAKGMLKFPRFERWRDDKSPQECLEEQLDG